MTHVIQKSDSFAVLQNMLILIQPLYPSGNTFYQKEKEKFFFFSPKLPCFHSNFVILIYAIFRSAEARRKLTVWWNKGLPLLQTSMSFEDMICQVSKCCRLWGLFCFMESSLCLCRFGLDLSKAKSQFPSESKRRIGWSSFWIGFAVIVTVMLDKVAAREAQFQRVKGHCAFSTQLFRSTASWLAS